MIITPKKQAHKTTMFLNLSMKNVEVGEQLARGFTI